ncbi:hypothetical protein [Kineosporia sp. R_H_3]|uniref:hypothetical protein n=1 Tax=Kineosporia sp. R_H_3 TaxID=1961848 RepID=UPI00117B6855|nr:hypothetical protein [Kineosporia sp. R_H_3]
MTADSLQAAIEDIRYHECRVLLLLGAVALHHATGEVEGITKLVRMDFFVRYPALAIPALALSDEETASLTLAPAERKQVESPMIHYKYGPWDHRFVPVLGALVGQGLAAIRLAPTSGIRLITITEAGKVRFSQLTQRPLWEITAARCFAVAAQASRLDAAALGARINAHISRRRGDKLGSEIVL